MARKITLKDLKEICGPRGSVIKGCSGKKKDELHAYIKGKIQEGSFNGRIPGDKCIMLDLPVNLCAGDVVQSPPQSPRARPIAATAPPLAPRPRLVQTPPPSPRAVDKCGVEPESAMCDEDKVCNIDSGECEVARSDLQIRKINGRLVMGNVGTLNELTGGVSEGKGEEDEGKGEEDEGKGEEDEFGEEIHTRVGKSVPVEGGDIEEFRQYLISPGEGGIMAKYFKNKFIRELDRTELAEVYHGAFSNHALSPTEAQKLVAVSVGAVGRRIPDDTLDDIEDILLQREYAGALDRFRQEYRQVADADAMYEDSSEAVYEDSSEAVYEDSEEVSAPQSYVDPEYLQRNFSAPILGEKDIFGYLSPNERYQFTRLRECLLISGVA